MAQPDILLKQDRISVVGNQQGNGQVDFEVAASEDTDPSVTVNADEAKLALGGQSTDGSVELTDGNGETRVQIGAGGLGAPEMSDDDQVWIDGTAGEIQIKQGSSWGADVTISADPDGDLVSLVALGGNLTSRIQPDIQPRSDDEMEWGPATLGAIQNDSGRAGIARFEPHGRAETSVEVRGDEAMLSLGYSVPAADGTITLGGEKVEIPTFDIEDGEVDREDGDDGDNVVAGAGKKGKIVFDDSKGWKPKIVAENGQLKFMGVAGSNGNSQTFMVIDAKNEEIRTPWTFEDGQSNGGN